MDGLCRSDEVMPDRCSVLQNRAVYKQYKSGEAFLVEPPLYFAASKDTAVC